MILELFKDGLFLDAKNVLTFYFPDASLSKKVVLVLTWSGKIAIAFILFSSVYL